MDTTPHIIEYIDRSTGTVGIGTFYRITSLDDINAGDLVVCPEHNPEYKDYPAGSNERRAYYGGVRDFKSNLPILLKVKAKTTGIHVSTGYGAIAFDLLYKEIE